MILLYLLKHCYVEMLNVKCTEMILTVVINQLCRLSSKPLCIPSSKNSSKNFTKKFVPVPGWNDYVKEQHNIAINAFKWWNLNNKPLNGFIYHEMRTSRARFKYALRFTRNIEDTARADSLAKDLSDGTIAGFWDNVRKLYLLYLVIFSSKYYRRSFSLTFRRTIFISC